MRRARARENTIFSHKVRDLYLNFAIEPFLGLTTPVWHIGIGFKCLRSTILQLHAGLWSKSWFGCDSSKIIKFDVFGNFWWLKGKSAILFSSILVVLMETNRLVPWLRQSDHPIQKYHAPRARARENTIFPTKSEICTFKFCHRTFSRVNHTCLTHWNRFQMP